MKNVEKLHISLLVMLYFLVDILSIKKRHDLADTPNMICQTNLHGRSYSLALSVVLLLRKRKRSMRSAKIVVRLQQIQAVLNGLPVPAEGNGPPSQTGAEASQRQVLALDGRGVEELLRHMAVCDIAMDAPQLPALASLLHDAVVQGRAGLPVTPSPSSARVPDLVAVAIEECFLIRFVAIGDEYGHVPPRNLVELPVDEAAAHSPAPAVGHDSKQILFT